MTFNMLDIEPTKEKLHAALTFELVKNERRNDQLSQGHGIFEFLRWISAYFQLTDGDYVFFR